MTACAVLLLVALALFASVAPVRAQTVSFVSADRRHEQLCAVASPSRKVLRAKFERLKRQKANELKIAIAATELASALADEGALAQAIELHEFARAIRQRKLGPNHLLVAESLHALAVLAAKQERRDDAERLFRRVLEIREAKLGPTHGDVADVLEELSDLLPSDRRAEADALWDRAQIIRKTDRPSFLFGRGMGPGMRLVPPAVRPAGAPGVPAAPPSP
jgi:tetratricopeptide (TPR) repeat protein